MKEMSGHKPFYMLGPLVTDVAPGYDHIVTAIGASVSASYGCDFLCYVTPAEHLALPNLEDVITGVKTSRIAAHVGDMIKYPDRARQWDLDMAEPEGNSIGKRCTPLQSTRTRKSSQEQQGTRRYRCMHDVRKLLRSEDRQPELQPCKISLKK